jgi:hypothetical protein
MPVAKKRHVTIPMRRIPTAQKLLDFDEVRKTRLDAVV